jgi:hypothetical protein
MKVRNGFVSNSSSSSFVIHAPTAARNVVADLKARSGFDHIFDSLDEDIKDEILFALEQIIANSVIEVDDGGDW